LVRMGEACLISYDPLVVWLLYLYKGTLFQILLYLCSEAIC